MKPLENNINGILPIDKEVGISSYDVIRRLKPDFPRKYKIGHAGTLDPFASGLLLILIGKATKLSSDFMMKKKTYTFTIEFGYETNTQDPTGEEIAIDEANEGIDIEVVESEIQQMTGKQMQMPPSFSAKKVAGKSAYKYARAGITPKLEPKEIEIYSFKMVAFEWPTVSLEAEVSSGTYIRTIGVDLAKRLGRHATTIELRRTLIESFDVNDAFKSDLLGKEDYTKFIQSIDG